MTATGCGQRPGDYEDDALTSLLSHLNVSVSSSIWTRAESNFLNFLNFLNFWGSGREQGVAFIRRALQGLAGRRAAGMRR
jgi:hypothetical protein